MLQEPNSGTERYTTHTSANQKDNKNSSDEVKELAERIPITGTPFSIVGNTKDGYAGALNNYKLTETFSAISDVIDYIDNHIWQIIMSLIEIGIDLHDRRLITEMRLHDEKTKLEAEKKKLLNELKQNIDH